LRLFADDASVGVRTLNLSFRTTADRPWAAAGHEVALVQLLCQERTVPVLPRRIHPLSVSEKDGRYTVEVEEVRYVFDRPTGCLVSASVGGAEQLCEPVRPTVWRAPTDNDRIIRQKWEAAGYRDALLYCDGLSLADIREDEAVFVCRQTLAGRGCLPALRLSVCCRVGSDGRLTVECRGERREDAVFLPRFGFVFRMPQGTEDLRWFGCGPGEAYIDKRLASRLGDFRSTVSDQYIPYIKPQEHNSHKGCRAALVSHAAGRGLLFVGSDFSLSASRYSPEQLTAAAHDWELVPEEETTVIIDYKMSGLGSGSCGPQLAPAYQLRETAFDFSFWIEPVIVGDTDFLAEMHR
ncbi:MAG: glycoside hydrolase family 2, partial [Clostridia bacterium]|nr:glycoside hydrolase family 2 [Clostridia bacterium]